jgi:hypothetical protein
MYNINCLLEGDPETFTVEIDGSRTVSYLKGVIKPKEALAGVGADDLKLYHVNIPSASQQVYTKQADGIFKNLSNREPLEPWATLSAIEGGFPENMLHILVQPLQSELIDPRARGAVAETMR